MTRALTAWNAWQSWYAEKNPKPKDSKSPIVVHELYVDKRDTVDRKEYAKKSREAFKAALPNLSKAQLADTQYVFQTIPWLKKWHEETMTNAINSWRDKGKFKSVVRKAIKPIVQQVRHLFVRLMRRRRTDEFSEPPVSLSARNTHVGLRD